MEYGVALGGSAVYLASEGYDRRRFQGYDVFGMIPEPGEQDDEKSKAALSCDSVRSVEGSWWRGLLWLSGESVRSSV